MQGGKAWPSPLQIKSLDPTLIDTHHSRDQETMVCLAATQNAWWTVFGHLPPFIKGGHAECIMGCVVVNLMNVFPEKGAQGVHIESRPILRFVITTVSRIGLGCTRQVMKKTVIEGFKYPLYMGLLVRALGGAFENGNS